MNGFSELLKGGGPPEAALRPGRLLALLLPRRAREPLFELAAWLAWRGPVRVLDGGNCFNAYHAARALRRLADAAPGPDAAGPAFYQALDRLRVARAFTCYQMAALLEEALVDTGPALALDFLATFLDENVPLRERRIVLDGCMEHLRRLSDSAPVIVSLRPPPTPDLDPSDLLEVVQSAADEVWVYAELPGPPPAQLRLF